MDDVHTSVICTSIVSVPKYMQLNSWLHREYSVATYSVWILYRFFNITYVATSNCLSLDTNKVLDRGNYGKNTVGQDSESGRRFFWQVGVNYWPDYRDL